MKKTTVSPSSWLSLLPKYPFVELRNKKQSLKEKGIKVIDFSIGDPVSPTPDFIINRAQESMKTFQNSGYPDNRGLKDFRKLVSEWLNRRFGIMIDPEKEIFPSLGAKEAIFAFPSAISGGTVIVPTPGYPPYYSGALAAGKKIHLVPLKRENHFLPDLDSIPVEIAKDAKIFWINYPNNPTSVLASKKFFRDIIEFCHDHDIIIASDECYSEIYQEKPPESILQYEKNGVIVFQSLSKRSNMTGWRIGYMAGDSDIINVFLTAKENMDSGCCNFIQMAAAISLSDENHVAKMRREYNEKRTIMKKAIKEIGFSEGFSEGTFYIWQPLPENISSIEFASRLLEEDIALVVTPGPALANNMPDGTNPGEGFVRFALVPTIDQTREAAERLIKSFKTILKK